MSRQPPPELHPTAIAVLDAISQDDFEDRSTVIVGPHPGYAHVPNDAWDVFVAAWQGFYAAGCPGITEHRAVGYATRLQREPCTNSSHSGVQGEVQALCPECLKDAMIHFAEQEQRP